MDVDPVARIAIQMGQLILAIDSHNRQKKVSAPPPPPPLTPSQPVLPVAETPATASTPILKRADFEGL
jgi:hypothetical protein